jgi:hypothetical protein
VPDYVWRKSMPFERDCLHGHFPKLGAKTTPNRRNVSVCLTAPSILLFLARRAADTRSRHQIVGARFEGGQKCNKHCSSMGQKK